MTAELPLRGKAGPTRSTKLVDLLIELALERENDSHMEKFLKKHLGRGGTPTPERGRGKGPKNPTNANKGGGKGRGNLRAIHEVKPDAGTPPLFYCKPVNDKGGACHAPDCDHSSSCMLQMKGQQHTKDGKAVTHQDHFRCTITCGYCGKRCHYEEECHIKKRESDKLKRQEAECQKPQTPTRNPPNGDKGGKGGGISTWCIYRRGTGTKRRPGGRWRWTGASRK